MKTADIPLDFSITEGGPYCAALRRLHLLVPDMGRLVPRVLVLTLFAWVPMLLLSYQAWPSFFGAIDIHVRYLVALPLLLLADGPVHRRLRVIVGQFLERGIVEDLPRLKALRADTVRLRDSRTVELVLLGAMFLAGFVSPATVGADWQRTPAGFWHHWIALTFFRFIQVRWLWRLSLWFLFLLRLSRFPLRLNALHPDRAAYGLGLPGIERPGFRADLRGPLHDPRRLRRRPHLPRGRRAARVPPPRRRHPRLCGPPRLGPAPRLHAADLPRPARGPAPTTAPSSEYVRAFRERWMGRERQDLLGNADFQSLADQASACAVVRETRPIPFNGLTVAKAVVTAALPLIPVILMVVPVDQFLAKLLKILF